MKSRRRAPWPPERVWLNLEPRPVIPAEKKNRKRLTGDAYFASLIARIKGD